MTQKYNARMLSPKQFLLEVMWAGRDRDTARATLGQGLAVSAFPRYVPV
jgi:hypothetical protein